MGVFSAAGASPDATPQHSAKPWSLPLATDLPAVTLRNWHDLMQRLPGAWQTGVGGDYSFLGSASNFDQLSLRQSAAAQPVATLTDGPNRQAQSIFQRALHHDLLDTVLLHGQDRVEELMRAGAKMLQAGALGDLRRTDLKEGLLLADGSRICIRPETLEPMAFSLRYLTLRTQLWMREFPYDQYQLADGPESTKDIERAATRGLTREYSRLYEAAVALAAQPNSVKARLLELAPAHPCKPYAEAIDAEFERQYKQTEFNGWRLRKQLEPNGDSHRSVSNSRVTDLSLADKVFVHRLARFRLDTLRRTGSAGFESQLKFGRDAGQIESKPLTDRQLFGVPLRGLPTSQAKALLPDPLLERLAHADHSGWLHAVNFVDGLGLNELRQPRGGARGDDADRPYSEVPLSIRNRVRLNVLARAIILASDDNVPISKYLARNVLPV